MRESSILVDCKLSKLYKKNYEKADVSNDLEKITGLVTKGCRDEVEVRALSLERSQNISIEQVVRKHWLEDEKWGKIIQVIEQQPVLEESNYCIHEGILFKKKKQARNKWLICIPSKDREKVLHKYHEGELHPGINRMQKMVGNLMFWTGMMKI